MNYKLSISLGGKRSNYFSEYTHTHTSPQHNVMAFCLHKLVGSGRKRMRAKHEQDKCDGEQQSLIALMGFWISS